MEETASVGIAEFMLRNREHVCAITSYNNVLMLNQMRYQEEIKETPEVTKRTKVTAQELELAKKLINNLTATFNPAAFKDTYIAELKGVIKARAAGKHIRIAEPEEKPTATVKDLMDILKRSLEKGKKRA